MTEECIRGDPAASVRELLSEGGVGKILLGRRRVPKERVMEETAERISSEFPDLALVRVTTYSPALDMTSLPRDPVILFYSRELLSANEDVLPESVVALCAQELCHQVPAVFRIR